MSIIAAEVVGAIAPKSTNPMTNRIITITSGGIASKAIGGSFASGAISAAFVQLFNHHEGGTQQRDPESIGEPSEQEGQLSAIKDFTDNYSDMREANTIGADKYFHCKANCQAARRGSLGIDISEKISNAREWIDINIKSSPVSDSILDQEANIWGRNRGIHGNYSCDVECSIYRPKGLDSKY